MYCIIWKVAKWESIDLLFSKYMAMLFSLGIFIVCVCVCVCVCVLNKPV